MSLGVRKLGWIEVERMRAFCFSLSLLSKLTCCFSCCLCGLSHHHFSLGNTSVAVSLFLEHVRQAFCAAVGDLPFGMGLSPGALHGSSFPSCLKYHLFRRPAPFCCPPPPPILLSCLASLHSCYCVIHFLCQSSVLEHKLCEGGEVFALSSSF